MQIDKEAFRKKVERLDNMPSVPGILDKFNEMVNDPTISMGQIGELIAQEQMLAAKILKLVNSAFYGFPGRIGTITHALVLLGYDVVKGLILSATVYDAMSDKWSEMWHHSLAVSKACGLICEKRKIPDAEEVAMAGLLHDIGKVVFFMELPDIYPKVINGANKHRLPLVLAERKLLGFDHTEVASWLCEHWYLPQRLSMPMIHHHDPEQSKNAFLNTSTVFLADNVVKALGFGTSAGAKVMPVPPAVVEILEIDRESLEDLVKDLEKELQFIESE